MSILRLLVAIVLMLSLLPQCFGLEEHNLHIHIVGDSLWSIPPTPDFYTNWSSSHSFHTGDILIFNFNSDFHNVMEVSSREYDTCKAEQTIQAFGDGPISIPLIEEGVFYFICSVADYCASGQKLMVTVVENSPAPRPHVSVTPTASLAPTDQPLVLPTPHVTLSPPKPPLADGHSASCVTCRMGGYGWDPLVDQYGDLYLRGFGSLCFGYILVYRKQ